MFWAICISLRSFSDHPVSVINIGNLFSIPNWFRNYSSQRYVLTLPFPLFCGELEKPGLGYECEFQPSIDSNIWGLIASISWRNLSSEIVSLPSGAEASRP